MNIIGWWWNDVLCNPAGKWPSCQNLMLYLFLFSFVVLTFKPDGRHHGHNAISLLLGWIFFFSSMRLGQMYGFITDVPAECQIPWRKIFLPWAKMLHLIRSFCHLHLSPFPQKFVFTAVTPQNYFFFFHPTRGNTVLSFPQGESAQWVCTVFPKFWENSFPLVKDEAKVLQSSPVKRVVSKRAYAQQQSY